MNIEYAKTIPLREIFSKIGRLPVQKNGSDLFYLSPFYDSNTPSLQVNQADNIWHDTVKDISGGPLELAQAWLQFQNKQCSPKDGLRWLKFNIGYPPLLPSLGLLKTKPNVRLAITYKAKPQEGGLLRYAANRGIPPETAKQLFKQLYLINEETGREFVALGFRNEDKGFAIYSPETEAVLHPADVSVIRGAKPIANEIHIFKDVFDYWSVMTQRKYEAFDGDCIILNDYALIDHAAPYIRGFLFTELFTWFDNSITGQRATRAFGFFCLTEENLTHRVMQLEKLPEKSVH